MGKLATYAKAGTPDPMGGHPNTNAAPIPPRDPIFRLPAGSGPARTPVAPPQAAPAPVPAPSAPGPDYNALYQQALASSSAGVGQQFDLALRDIASREGSANQMVGMLPGQLGTIYNQSGQSLQHATGALDSAQQASGLRSFMSAGDQMQPLIAAGANDRAAHLSSVPVLGLAVQSAFGQQRSEVEQARAAAESEAAQRSQELSLRHLDAQQQHQWDLEARAASDAQGNTEAERQRQFQRRMAGRERQWALEDQATERASQRDPYLDAVDPALGVSPRQMQQAQSHYGDKWDLMLKYARGGDRQEMAATYQKLQHDKPALTALAEQAGPFAQYVQEIQTGKRDPYQYNSESAPGASSSGSSGSMSGLRRDAAKGNIIAQQILRKYGG